MERQVEHVAAPAPGLDTSVPVLWEALRIIRVEAPAQALQAAARLRPPSDLRYRLQIHRNALAPIRMKHGPQISVPGQALLVPSFQHALPKSFLEIRDAVRVAVAKGLVEAFAAGHGFVSP